MCVCLTSDNSRYAPAHGVVEPHVSVVDVAQLGQHPVDVQPLHEHPGKRAHIEVMEEDGYDRTHKLKGGKREREKEKKDKRGVNLSNYVVCIIHTVHNKFTAKINQEQKN